MEGLSFTSNFKTFVSHRLSTFFAAVKAYYSFIHVLDNDKEIVIVQ